MNDQATASNSTPPAGWYDSPAAQGQEQYWDGNAWSDLLRPKQAVSPEATQSAASSGPSFFKALFDTSFSDFVTIKFVKIIYLIGIVLNVLSWLGGALIGLIAAGIGAAAASSMYGGGGGGAFVFPILLLLLGWIPALLNIIMMRIGLEFIVASVRTAQNTSIMAGTSTPK